MNFVDFLRIPNLKNIGFCANRRTINFYFRNFILLLNQKDQKILKKYLQKNKKRLETGIKSDRNKV